MWFQFLLSGSRFQFRLNFDPHTTTNPPQPTTHNHTEQFSRFILYLLTKQLLLLIQNGIKLTNVVNRYTDCALVETDFLFMILTEVLLQKISGKLSCSTNEILSCMWRSNIFKSIENFGVIAEPHRRKTLLRKQFCR